MLEGLLYSIPRTMDKTYTSAFRQKGMEKGSGDCAKKKYSNFYLGAKTRCVNPSNLKLPDAEYKFR